MSDFYLWVCVCAVTLFQVKQQNKLCSFTIEFLCICGWYLKIDNTRSVPMKRLGSIEEVIKSVAFLLSDDSSYTTATNLVVDGGMSGGLKA